MQPLAGSAVDGRSGTKVAIKKLYRPFQSELFAKRAYRELRLLKHMKHENVIGILDVFTPDVTLEKFNDFYLVMPFMGTDLSKIMKHEKLTEDRIQFLDLKPGNLAVNEDCELKILDFGLARHTDSEMTGYVVTRWYRAPEVILNWMHYTQTVDIWSVGCIMAEMITGRPLFKGNDPVNLLEKMLVLDAEKRVTAAEALLHPYFEPIHDPEEEIEAEKYDDTFDNMDLPLDEWKRITYKEILNFKPPQTLDSKETAVQSAVLILKIKLHVGHFVGNEMRTKMIDFLFIRNTCSNLAFFTVYKAVTNSSYFEKHSDLLWRGSLRGGKKSWQTFVKNFCVKLLIFLKGSIFTVDCLDIPNKYKVFLTEDLDACQQKQTYCCAISKWQSQHQVGQEVSAKTLNCAEMSPRAISPVEIIERTDITEPSAALRHGTDVCFLATRNSIPLEPSLVFFFFIKMVVLCCKEKKIEPQNVIRKTFIQVFSKAIDPAKCCRHGSFTSTDMATEPVVPGKLCSAQLMGAYGCHLLSVVLQP
ncbi:hypothetical protein EK904_001413 [Melospiza melodia maxima]|nr:hypothetical protein EK904_001413 [Melospiza melodia maxima]